MSRSTTPGFRPGSLTRSRRASSACSHEARGGSRSRRACIKEIFSCEENVFDGFGNHFFKFLHCTHRIALRCFCSHLSAVLENLERRKTFLELGYSSVFDFCTRRIKYSSSQAGRRIQAARCCRRYPEFFGYLRNREVCIMTLAMIEGIINDDNKDEIVKRVRGASRRDVERLISEYRPAAALRDRIRYVHVPLPQPRDLNTALVDRACQQVIPEQYRDRIPAVEKVFVQFLADEEFLTLFEEVRGLMGGDAVDASFANVMKLVLKEYRDRHSPAARKQRREERKRETTPDSHRWEWKNAQDESTRHVPDEFRDEVFVRDEGQCTFLAPDGTRCQCRKGLQVDHIQPFAAGGTHHPENLRLLCGAHNRLAAERTLGMHVMQPFWRRQ